MKNETIKITDVDTGDGVFLPAKRILCPSCDGDGKVENPAFSNGITVSEWNEWDDYEKGQYFTELTKEVAYKIKNTPENQRLVPVIKKLFQKK